MSELTIAVDTSKTAMTDVRPVLDAALQEEFPGGMLKWRWEGDVVHLSGPGAAGTIILEAGRLVGHADLKPPTSLMRPVIEQKISRAMHKGATA